MAPRDGVRADNLTHLDKLRDTPEKHHIFHAFRILESAFPDAPRIGNSRRPREDNVLFEQEAELSFPPSTVSDFAMGKAGKPARLTNRFFGLFGLTF